MLLVGNLSKLCAVELPMVRSDWIAQGTRNRFKVLKAIPFDFHVTRGDVVKKTGLGYNTVRGHLEALVDQGKVKSIKVGPVVGYCRTRNGDKKND